MEKQCFKCGEIRSLSEFYKHPKMTDGHVNKCKECNKKDVRENRAKKLDYYQEYDRARSMRADRVEARAAYQQTERGKDVCARLKKRYIEKNPIKRGAHNLVNNAVKCGRLAKPDQCESCGVEPKRLHGHHDDYEKPLDVRWLCSPCHTTWHRENGPGANAS